jgi:hypothetical protein
VDDSPAATRYAAVAAFWAASDAASAASVVPETVPGGKPVIDEAAPGDSPMSPVITEEPVLVMATPAITAYGAAAPKVGEVAAKADGPPKPSTVTNPREATPRAPRPTRAPEKERGRRCNPRVFQKLMRMEEGPFTVGVELIFITALGNELISTSTRLKTDS